MVEQLNMTMRWYVVQAFSGFENSVKRSLEERVQRAGPVSYTHLTLPTIPLV